MKWSVETLLWVHSLTVSVFLGIMGLVLWRKRLFRWDSAGFWAWASFMLYYVLNPFFTLRNQETLMVYHTRLALADGIARGQWILLVLLFGMSAFFWAYLRTKPSKIHWRLRSNAVSLPMIAALLPFVAFGVYSLLTRRSFLVNTGRQAIIEGGRFVGQVTGYENAGYKFLVVPILLLLLSRGRWQQLVGWLAAGGFILLSLPKGWARYVLVSMLIALSLVHTLRRRASWPPWYYLPLILIFTLSLQLRGHSNFNFENTVEQTLTLFSKSVQNIGTNTASAIGSSEVSALSTWYLDSYIIENYSGYSYGLPILNYLLTGWIPSRFFPQKYFLIDWLASIRRPISPSMARQLYGAKVTLFGSFYREGGAVAVAILGALAGFLSRKLDGMLQPGTPLLVRATGIAWMSELWMVWQSGTTWGLVSLGILCLPAIALWLFAPKIHRVRSFARDKPHYGTQTKRSVNLNSKWKTHPR